MYESYEYLPANDNEAETDQFFVVQNDGTFLINRQEVHYVTQMQDVKTLEQSSAGYSVAPQEYYVDVDSTNTEPILVTTDQFVLPNNEAGHVFGSNYLLQSIQNVPVPDLVPISHPKTEPPEQEEAPAATQPETNLTEITLSDDQWKILEEKGCVLIDIYDKIYLLDPFGLRDVSNNEELVQRIRNGNPNTEQIPETTTVQEATVLDVAVNEADTEQTKSSVNIIEDVKYIIPDPIDNSTATGLVTEEAENQSLACEDEATSTQAQECTSEVTSRAPAEEIPQKKQKVSDAPKSLRFKTKLKLKDIPEKLILGKTVNGKNLIAKIVSVQKEFLKKEPHAPPPPPAESNETIVTKIDAIDNETASQSPQSEEIQRLFNMFLEDDSVAAASRTRHVIAVESIMKNLLAVENFRDPFIGQNLLVTKIVNSVKSDNTVTTSVPSFVTGRVVQLGNTNDWQFVHVPHLLQLLKSGEEEEYELSVVGEPVKLVCGKRSQTLMHVHVVETKEPNKPTKTSITSSKQVAVVGPPSGADQLKRMRKEWVHACCACATLFPNEQELIQHQEEKCPFIPQTGGEDDCTQPLNIQFEDEAVIANVFARTEKKHIFKCSYCNRGVNVSNLKRHLQTHLGPVTDKSKQNDNSTEEDAGSPKSQSKAPYKCNMCPSVYYYSSTLSKHIMKQHIKLKIDSN